MYRKMCNRRLKVKEERLGKGHGQFIGSPPILQSAVKIKPTIYSCLGGGKWEFLENGFEKRGLKWSFFIDDNFYIFKKYL